MNLTYISSSKEGRVINEQMEINIPVLDKGKTRHNYPRNYKFQFISVNYKGYLNFINNENIILIGKEVDLLKDFESLPELNVKNIKVIKGHEGEPCFQCSIYFKSKKVAEYNGYEWFSGQEIEILDKEIISKLTKEQELFFVFKQEKSTYTIKNSAFIELITNLCEMKKHYKMIM